MSSILGGLVWLFAHFARVAHPMARDQIAMTMATLGLMGLLVVRHRKNLARIGAGTEPKVNFARKKKHPRPDRGQALPIVLLVDPRGREPRRIGASFAVESRAGSFEVDRRSRIGRGRSRLGSPPATSAPSGWPSPSGASPSPRPARGMTG